MRLFIGTIACLALIGCASQSTTAGSEAAECKTHANHKHKHDKDCGHKAVKHGDHMDYVHEGDMHAAHENHWDEHKKGKQCEAAMHKGHTHKHGKDCGHKTVKHKDHTDYEHDGHWHHAHMGHYDEHQTKTTKSDPTSDQG